MLNFARVLSPIHKGPGLSPFLRFVLACPQNPLLSRVLSRFVVCFSFGMLPFGHPVLLVFTTFSFVLLSLFFLLGLSHQLPKAPLGLKPLFGLLSWPMFLFSHRLSVFPSLLPFSTHHLFFFPGDFCFDRQVPKLPTCTTIFPWSYPSTRCLASGQTPPPKNPQPTPQWTNWLLVVCPVFFFCGSFLTFFFFFLWVGFRFFFVVLLSAIQFSTSRSRRLVVSVWQGGRRFEFLLFLRSCNIVEGIQLFWVFSGQGAGF